MRSWTYPVARVYYVLCRMKLYEGLRCMSREVRANWNSFIYFVIEH